MRHREAPETFHRFRTCDIKLREVPAVGDKPKRKAITMLASTDAAIDWGGFREVLVHTASAIDWTAARAILLNHNPNRIVGAITAVRVGPDGLEIDAELMDGATMESGVTVADAIDSGALRGVSIGYHYSMSDTTFDEQSRTLTVSKWRLLENSLTPIPADDSAQLRTRSLPDSLTNRAATAAQSEKESSMKFEQWLVARGFDAVKLTTEDSAKLRSIFDLGAEPAADFAPHARIVKAPVIDQAVGNEAVRAAQIAIERETAALAKSYGLDAADFIGMTRDASRDAMLRAMAAKNATKEPDHAVTGSTVNYDQADKARDAFCGALANQVGFRGGVFAPVQVNNNLLGGGINHAIRKYARLMGHNTEDWTRKDVAMFALGKPSEMSTGGRSAAVTSANFQNFVFLNAMTKIVANGFQQGSATARYRRIVSTQIVPDFKQFSIGGIASGNFVKTAENVAFPELDKSEGVYNSTVKMWGGTISLTMQAIINDDTSSFDRMARQAGPICDKTMDRRTFQKLLMGTSTDEATATWTSNTTSGGTLVYTTQDLMAAARAKLGLVRAAMVNKIGLDGNPLGNLPSKLLVPITREMEAQGICGVSGPGLQAGAQQTAVSMEVIASPWLEASALIGNSTTSYYLLADPNEVTGLVLSEISGFEQIQVQPYDAGGVAAINMKLWKPFEVDLFWVNVGVTPTKTIVGAQQGTT